MILSIASGDCSAYYTPWTHFFKLFLQKLFVNMNGETISFMKRQKHFYSYNVSFLQCFILSQISCFNSHFILFLLTQHRSQSSICDFSASVRDGDPTKFFDLLLFVDAISFMPCCIPSSMLHDVIECWRQFYVTVFFSQ